MKSIYYFLLFNLLLFSCKNEGSDFYHIEPIIDESQYLDSRGLFNIIDGKISGLNFINEIPEQLEYNMFYYEYSFNGGGVAISDLDGDGWQDVVMTSSVGKNKIFKNLGHMKFQDVTEVTGINPDQGFNAGVALIDINNDKKLDIYISRSGNLNDIKTRTNQLFVNQGNFTFIEKAAEYGIADASYTTQTYFSDIDLDGDLDVFMVNHPINWGKNNQLNFDNNYNVILDTTRQYVSDRLYINDGKKFIDKTKAYGVDNIAFGLSASIADVNGDNYPDIYVANDYVSPDHLYINQSGKGFKDEILKYFKNISTTSMGSDFVDLNNDGKFDLFVNDMQGESSTRMKESKSFVNYDAHLLAKKHGYHDQFRYNTMQLANGKGFSNIAQMTNTGKTEWSWAVLGADYDHNGHEDLFITNGYYIDANNLDYNMFLLDSLRKNTRQEEFFKKWRETLSRYPSKNYFYSNAGNLRFDNVSKIWNTGDASFSNGAAYGDLDNDGDLDLIVNNIMSNATLMENKTNEKIKTQYVNLALQSKDLNSYAIGAEMQIMYSDGTSMYKLFQPIRGYMSTCEYRINVGIPKGKTLKEVIVKWPKGHKEVFTNLPVNKLSTIEEGKGSLYQSPTSTSNIFVATPFSWKHKENDYIDFKREPLIHLKNSCNGPTISVGDVNKDGLDDLYLGGAANQQGSVYLQQSIGSWQFTSQPDLAKDSIMEDEASAFGDVDNDGDLDLLIASGGYEFEVNSPKYSLRMYSNNGSGLFTKSLDALPKITINSNALKVGDLDGDKDIDIFLGGGPIPNKYPNGEKSYLLINEKGKFKDASQLLPENGNLGIVKDAEIADINGDGKNDLVTAGDYQPIRVLIHEGNTFSDETKKYGVAQSHGLWQELLIEDMDGDGDKDVVAGNMGLNSFFKASPEKPTCIYSGDFDKNKEHDAIMCTYFGNKSWPVHSREELLNHMTKLRKKFRRNNPYARASLDDIFDNIGNATVFNAFKLSSVFLKNEGGKFIAMDLPVEAQLSFVNGISLLKKDGKSYLITSGNFWDTDFDFGKYDASTGAVFECSKNGFMPVKNSGFFEDGNIREQRNLTYLGKPAIIVCGNNESPRIYH